jgi:ribosome-binding protein aMBF1 (putative translation factor)
MSYSDNVEEDLREKVRQAILASGISQTAMATQLGVKPENLSRMLNGRSGGISKLWRELLDALDLELTVQRKRKNTSS